MAQARAQGVIDVLNSHYIPTTADDKAIFHKQQAFMYAVFERTLQTDQGKAFVRAHENDFDAQHVYASLVAYSVTSTKAALDSSHLLSYITAAKLADGNWKGSAHSFILHWQDKVRLYEKQVPTDEHFSGRMKRTMLENAVQPLTELRAIKIQADQHKTQSGIDLTYEQYVDLLMSAASNYDIQFKPKDRHGSAPSRRAVYSHELQDPEDVIEVDGGHFDIDADSSLPVGSAFGRFTHALRSLAKRLTRFQGHLGHHPRRG